MAQEQGMGVTGELLGIKSQTCLSVQELRSKKSAPILDLPFKLC